MNPTYVDNSRARSVAVTGVTVVIIADGERKKQTANRTADFTKLSVQFRLYNAHFTEVSVLSCQCTNKSRITLLWEPGRSHSLLPWL